jgi:hypothetical protein
VDPSKLLAVSCTLGAERAWRTALIKADVPYFPIYSHGSRILYATQLGSTGCDCPARNAPQQPGDETSLSAGPSFTRFESTSNERMKKPI